MKKRATTEKKRKSTTLKGRIKQRRPYKIKDILRMLYRGLRVTSLAAICVALIIGAVELWNRFEALESLAITNIEVQGTERLSPDLVKIASGIEVGDNIMLTSLNKACRQVAELPWIRRVSIKREFPHRVTIVVYEREPYALVNLGRLFYIDRAGVDFAPWEAGITSDLPIISGLDVDDLRRDREESLKFLGKALGLLFTVESSDIIGLNGISEVNIELSKGLNIVTVDSGVRIKMGFENFRERLDNLARLMRTLGPKLEGVNYVDLKYLDRAIVKFENQDLVKKFTANGFGS